MIMVVNGDLINGLNTGNKVYHLRIMNRPYLTVMKRVIGDPRDTKEKAVKVLEDSADLFVGADAVINVHIEETPKRLIEKPSDKYLAYGQAIDFADDLHEAVMNTLKEKDK